jgi:hypothetical protein
MLATTIIALVAFILALSGLVWQLKSHLEAKSHIEVEIVGCSPVGRGDLFSVVFGVENRSRKIESVRRLLMTIKDANGSVAFRDDENFDFDLHPIKKRNVPILLAAERILGIKTADLINAQGKAFAVDKESLDRWKATVEEFVQKREQQHKSGLSLS